MLTKEETQKYYFDLFRKNYRLPSDALIEHGDKPDVILSGKRRIGIEITNFYLQSGGSQDSEQVQRELREKTVSAAQGICKSRGGGEFHLTLGFDSAFPVRDSRSLADRIANLALRIEVEKRGRVSRNLFRDIPELNFVWLSTARLQDRWEANRVFSCAVMNSDKLKGIIAENEAKSRQYQPCDAYWLLVVVDFLDRAQDQEIATAQDLGAVQSEVFEKIFVYKTVFGQVLEIPSDATRFHQLRSSSCLHGEAHP